MDPALITAICGGIVAIISAFWGIIKHYDVKKERREKEAREATERRIKEERDEHERIRLEDKAEYETRLAEEKEERLKYEQEIKNERDESNERRVQLYTLVENTLEHIEESNVEQQNSINKLTDAVADITNKIVTLDATVNEQKQEIFDNEVNRLQTAISDFANMVRGGIEITPDNYRYVCSAYDKYKRMGGNSFIDAAMEYIRAEYLKGVSEE